jgi:hypothetical protein
MAAPKKSAQKESVEVAQTEAAQDMAQRIWDGQSPDVPTAERLSRVAAGLEAQGMSIDLEFLHAV